MKLTVDNTVYKYKFDQELTLEVICYLFALNYKQAGDKHISLNNLFTMLFLIDVISLQETYCLVTGDEYLFVNVKDMKVLARNVCNNLYVSNFYKELFNIKVNIVSCINESVFTISEFNYLSEYLKELIQKVYTCYMFGNAYTDLLDELLTEEAQPWKVKHNSNFGHSNFITLDYLIDILSLDKEAITEALVLHNNKQNEINS